MTRNAFVASALAVLFLTALVYAPGLAGGFVFDDFPNILRNEAIRNARLEGWSLWQAALSSPSGPLARPIASLSFALQVALQGLSAPALKSVNLAIHLGCGLLLWAWLATVIRTPRIAASLPDGQRQLVPLLVSALWLVAPINLTAVLYVVQRMESLSVLFTLTGLLLYTRARLHQETGHARPGSPFAGLMAMTALATLTKETGVLTPAYALVTEALAFGFRTRGRRDGRVAAFFIAVCAVPAVAGIALTLPDALNGRSYASRPFDLATRLMTEGRILWDYLSAILLPRLASLSLYHDDFPVSRSWLAPPTTLVAWVALALLLWLAFRLRRSLPLVSLGLGVFFVGHSLVSTWLPLELYHEHRNYLPAAGIFLALVAAGARLAPRLENPRVLGLAFVALFLLQAGTTFLRASEWSDPLRLAYVEATRHPTSPRANYDLALLLSVVSQGPEDPRHGLALATFREAARLPGAGLLPLQALIFVASRHGQPVELALWRQLEKAVAHKALSAADEGALYSLVDCVARRLCPLAEARPLEHVLRVALAYHPDRTTLYILLARLRLSAHGDAGGAERLLQQALSRSPTDAQLWLSLARVQATAEEDVFARKSLERSEEFDRLGRFALERAALRRQLQAHP